MLAPANDNVLTLVPPPAATPEPAEIMLVREFNAAGPCITRGTLISESAAFYTFTPRYGCDSPRRVSKSRAHIEPCRSCRDHAETSYPNGYDN